ncbi:glycogen synthase GlgA [Novosphingobium umbonatum]|uniref:Glycogen synthase n=1 Tax=Novosphingobium umbonatum TaxID=1908524 RepID=A0A437N5V0_9SPHN|nr:glycogen synthase GlgA [Novosphingobium umbonatum]RVU05309.1 glycogen synthase GlgA [Novosphingobium umbonatum]
MLRVLSVASEAVPFIKTGGLADVAGALPAALAPHGVAMTTLIPGYPAVLTKLAAQAKPAKGKRALAPAPKVLHEWDDLLGRPARLLAGTLDGKPDGPSLLVLDCPALFVREGGPYGDAAGHDWPDNPLRFAAFARAAADVAGGVVEGLAFDLLHSHDWQAGLAPAYLRFAPVGAQRIPAIMTIHNMAFQGHYGAEIFPLLGLPAHAWSMHGVEYHGGVGYLKAGLEAAQAITTVSPTYAREIRDPHFGMGLEGLIISRGDRVRGIVNGIDDAEWNPQADSALAEPFSVRTLSRRRANKRALEAEFGLESGDGPIFIVVSRLTWQKGMDVLPECLDALVAMGGRLALLGSGDAAIVAELNAAAARHAGKVAIRIGYDEALAHRMQAGGDAILVPSRFEPCGLTQLYGLAYGCIPVVARTGGLADTVVDANLAAVKAGVATGVQFDVVSAEAMIEAMSRTVSLYNQGDTWRRIQKNAMLSDFTWQQSGGTYAELYSEITQEFV